MILVQIWSITITWVGYLNLKFPLKMFHTNEKCYNFRWLKI